MSDADPKFNRRDSDVNVAALAFRVDGLERRVGVVESELRANRLELAANTALTRQVHTMAERVEKNTKDIVLAVKWLSTTKKVVIALVAGVGGLATAGIAVVGFLKLIGIA